MARPKGIPHTEEHKRRISEIMKPIVRANMAAGKHKIPTTKGLKRGPHSAEWKQAMSRVMQDKWASGEIVKTGYRHTEEAKHRIAKTGLGRNSKIGPLYDEPLYLRAERGLPILCLKHGEHTDWGSRGKKHGAVCRPCAAEKNWIRDRDNYIRTLVYRCQQADNNSEITEEFLFGLLKSQNNKCAVTGIEFSIGSSRADNDRRPSVDKINPLIGYKKSNVHLVRWPINRLKLDFKLERFIELCHQVSAHQKSIEMSETGT